MTSRGAGPAITVVIGAHAWPVGDDAIKEIATALAKCLRARVEFAVIDGWSREEIAEATARPRGHLVVLRPDGLDAREIIRAGVHEFACPTLIVPSGVTRLLERPARLLCGVADDAAAAGVARFAGRLCASIPASLSLLHVPSPGDDPATGQGVLARCAPTLSPTVKATLQIRPGRAVATLRATARSERASMIVVGRPRHPEQVGTMLGSVPHALLRHGDLPLLVVPPPVSTVSDP